MGERLFTGLPWPITLLFLVAFVVIVVGTLWAFVLLLRGNRAVRRAPDPATTDDLLWVFLVPALNEEVTAADSVRRLRAVAAENSLILVIDDGSDDATPQVLAGLAGPDLEVLRRDPPDARRGKAAALNAAYQHVGRTVLARGRFAGWPRDRVAVVVVDADGRLDPGAPAYLAAHLADERVGGIQVSVRIYNRGNPLTWFQDVEFGVYGGLYQMGRTGWGTAGMGGNGQCNRLSALDAVADEEGPWRHTLTEDQEIGLRLIEAGWRSVHEARTSIDQQGLSNLRTLYRQRTRWSQGNIQAMAHLHRVPRAPAPVIARVDLVHALLQPVLQAWVGASTVTALVLALFFDVPFVSSQAWWWWVFLFLLAFGGTSLGCMVLGRGHGTAGYLKGLLIAVPYAFYAWVLWPVVVRAFLRQARGASSWAKTEREAISQDVAAPGPGEGGSS